ncbi:hypothetical protein D9M71_492720 [compost metagenome]
MKASELITTTCHALVRELLIESAGQLFCTDVLPRLKPQFFWVEDSRFRIKLVVIDPGEVGEQTANSTFDRLRLSVNANNHAGDFFAPQ